VVPTATVTLPSAATTTLCPRRVQVFAHGPEPDAVVAGGEADAAADERAVATEGLALLRPVRGLGDLVEDFLEADARRELVSR
jgi:hypothetical protein